MYIDAELLFAENQAITATAYGAGVIDLGAAGDAVGHELTIHVVVNTTFAGGASGETMTIGVQSTDNVSNGSPNFTDTTDTLLSSGAIPATRMVAGEEIFTVRVPKGMKRYVRLKFTKSSSTAFTAGAVTAFASKDL